MCWLKELPVGSRQINRVGWNKVYIALNWYLSFITYRCSVIHTCGSWYIQSYFFMCVIIKWSVSFSSVSASYLQIWHFLMTFSIVFPRSDFLVVLLEWSVFIWLVNACPDDVEKSHLWHMITISFVLVGDVVLSFRSFFMFDDLKCLAFTCLCKLLGKEVT